MLMGGDVAVAIVWVLGDVLSKPFGLDKCIGGVHVGKLHLHQQQAFVATVEDVEFGNQSAIESVAHQPAEVDAIACLADKIAVAFTLQTAVRISRKGEFLFPVDYGTARENGLVFFDG